MAITIMRIPLISLSSFLCILFPRGNFTHFSTFRLPVNDIFLFHLGVNLIFFDFFHIFGITNTSKIYIYLSLLSSHRIMQMIPPLLSFTIFCIVSCSFC